MRHFTGDPVPDPELSASSDRRLLVGIDAPLSAETRYALETIGAFVAPFVQQVRFLLLHVILVPYIGGRHAPTDPFPPTPEEWKQAAEALEAAGIILQKRGIPSTRIEAIIRVGSAAEELACLAKQHPIDCLVLGTRRPPPLLGLRRLLLGNLSQDVLRKASCPVLVVTLPHARRAVNLVVWYETAIQQALHEHPTALVNLTASDVVAWFPPPQQTARRHQERKAAALALERLVDAGVLSRQQVQGEMHYLSD